MSCPRVIFIDTSIFDSQKYNFASNAVEPFLKAVSGKSLTLLVPDPMEREVTRHMRDRCCELDQKLRKLESEYPFLSKWKKWPKTYFFEEHPHDVLKREWEGFLAHFNVVRLGYNEIDFKQIMDWYDAGHAPFGPKKEKEFPDALSLAAIVNFAKQELCSVAVVSQDADFKRACIIYTELFYFDSLPAYTEAILSSDKRLLTLKGKLEEDSSKIVEAIADEFGGHTFEYEEIPSVDVDEVDVNDVELTQFRIIALGDRECTISFDAKVDYSAWIHYEEEVEDYRGYSHTREREGWVEDWTEVWGVAKFQVSSSWESLEEAVWVKFDHPKVYITETLRDY